MPCIAQVAKTSRPNETLQMKTHGFRQIASCQPVIREIVQGIGHAASEYFPDNGWRITGQHAPV